MCAFKQVYLILFTLAFTGLMGCDNSNIYRGFPQDSDVRGPFEVTSVWLEVTFPEPLRINRDGTQTLHLLTDHELYMLYAAANPEDWQNASYLWRFDGLLVKPEVILITDTGEVLPLQASSNLGLTGGGITVGFSMPTEDVFELPPPLPASAQSIVKARLRSNEPLIVEQLLWRVSSHPDYYRCLGECPWWRFW